MDRSEGPWLDSFSVETDIAPIRRAVPIWPVFGLMRFHRFLNRHATSFRQLVGHTDFSNGFFLPFGHGFAKSAPVINTPMA